MTKDKWRLRLELIELGWVKQVRTPFVDGVEYRLIWGDMSLFRNIFTGESTKDELDILWEEFFFFVTRRYFSLTEISTTAYDAPTKTLAQ